MTQRSTLGLLAICGLFGLVFACSGTSGEEELPLSDDAPPTPRRSKTPGGELGGSARTSPSSSNDAGEGGVDGNAPDSTAPVPPLPTAPPTSPPPPPSAPVPECKLDTHAIYIQGGRRIESLTAYGKYWSREVLADGSAVEAVGFPHAVMSDPKFASGPCSGRTTCELDTRAIFFDGATKTEWTTAYGRAWQWTFDSQGAPVNAGGAGTLATSVSAWGSGPCAFASSGVCTFGTRTYELQGSGAVETITAYGRWFEYSLSAGTRTPRGSFGATLESIARYATGPCASQPAGACVLDTRTIYVDLDGSRIEEVTARNRRWVYQLSSNDAVIAKKVDGAPIANTPRLVGPCTHVTI